MGRFLTVPVIFRRIHLSLPAGREGGREEGREEGRENVQRSGWLL